MAVCSKCGMELNEESVFCPKCGAPVEQNLNQNNTEWGQQGQVYQQPQQSYQPNRQNYPPSQQNYQSSQQNYQPLQSNYQQRFYPQQGHNIDTSSMMIWAVINVLFCWPLSIFSFITLDKVNKAPTREEGFNLLNQVKTINIIASILGGLILIIVLAVGFE